MATVAAHNLAMYVVDGTAMFTPTPHLLPALEWLVHVLEGGPDATRWLETSTFPFEQVDGGTSSSRRGHAAAPELVGIEELHRLACEGQQAMYTDGVLVMTAYQLKDKQVCCGNGCRHCPYGHVNVRDPARRTNKLTETVLL